MSTLAWQQACLNAVNFKLHPDAPKGIFAYIEMQYIGYGKLRLKTASINSE
jgi:hypothetical protein